jgi:hypothetical protein
MTSAITGLGIAYLASKDAISQTDSVLKKSQLFMSSIPLLGGLMNDMRSHSIQKELEMNPLASRQVNDPRNGRRTIRGWQTKESTLLSLASDMRSSYGLDPRKSADVQKYVDMENLSMDVRKGIVEGLSEYFNSSLLMRNSGSLDLNIIQDIKRTQRTMEIGDRQSYTLDLGAVE